MTTLRTKRLILRKPSQADLQDLYRVYSDPKVMRYWSNPPHPDLAATQVMLDRHIAAADRDHTYFVIERDGQAIGCAGVHEDDEIGFILSADQWRQGLMSEVLDKLIPHYLIDRGYPQLTADADPRNAASVATLRAAGFRQTGTAKNTFCVNGEWSDSVYFTLCREDFHKLMQNHP